MKSIAVLAVAVALAGCSSSASTSSSPSRSNSRGDGTSTSTSLIVDPPTSVISDPPPTLTAPGDVANARALAAAVSGAVRCDSPFEDDDPGFNPHPHATSAGFCNLAKPAPSTGGADGYFIVWSSAAARDEDPILSGCTAVTPQEITDDEQRYIVIGHNWGIGGIFGYSARQLAGTNGAEAFVC